jgi:20S proteasome subunit beta 4
VNLLIAGYDPKKGGELYFMDYLGTLAKTPFVAHGYGGLFSLSVMDRYYKPNATKEEAVEIIKNCIREVQQRLIINFPNFQLKFVDKDGISDGGMINAADLKLSDQGGRPSSMGMDVPVR